MSFSVKYENPEAVQKMLARMAGGMEDVAEDAAEDMVLEADRLAKDHARDNTRSPKRRTGRYFGSIHSEIKKKGKGFLTGAIASNVKYAGWLEDGTKPHVIRPKNKKALFWPGAAHPVKQVNHPGTPAFKVLTGARDQVVKDAQKFVNAAMKRKFRK
jgi:bacteriophage HK97-gp10 putative tail-component